MLHNLLALYGNPVTFWTWVSSLVAAVAAVFGIVLAMISQLASAKQESARFYLSITDRYNAPEMQAAAFALREFYSAHRLDFDQIFREEFPSRTERALRVDRARRVLNRYFSNIAEMRRARLISKRLATLLINFQGLNTFYTVVVPLNTAKYGLLDENVRIYNELRRIKKKFGNGFVVFNDLPEP